MDYSPRILAILCFLAGGFVYPILWIVAAAIAASIFLDASPNRHSESDGRFPSLAENDSSWLPKVRDCTESPAETAFLDAMIEAFKLEPEGRALKGAGLKLRLQVKALQYRLDFLVDENLVVEIDGAEWHSSPDAIARDKTRDAVLKEAGYIVLRIPAKIALYQGSKAVKMVSEMQPIASAAYNRDQSKRREDLRNSLRPGNLVRTANSKLTALADITEQAADRAREYKEQQAANEIDKQLIDQVITRKNEIVNLIRREFPPRPESRFEPLRLGGIHKMDNGIIKCGNFVGDEASTTSEARRKLKIAEERLEILRQLESFENEMDEKPELADIFDRIDNEPIHEILKIK